MDPSNNPLERILDLTHSDQNLHSFINNENSHPLDSFSLFPINHDSKNTEKNDFLPFSPNPFKNERKNSLELTYEFKNHCSSNEYFINRRFIFDEDENVSKWNCVEKESEFPSEENVYSIKKTDIFETPHKEKIENFDQKFSSLEEFKLSKHERGLKALSEIIYNILKKNEKATFNIVAELLVENFETKCHEEGRELEEKAEKNIRRRTYDALNVLISAGIVDKIGKCISLKKKNTDNDEKFSRNHVTLRELKLEQLKEELEEKIKDKFFVLKKKEEEFKNLLERKKNIKKFFENKIEENYIDSKDNVEKIDFPFLCIKTKKEKFVKFTEESNRKNSFAWDKDNSSTCDQYKEEKVVNLYFNSQNIHECFMLEGDVDFISNLGNMMTKSKV